MEKLDWSEVSEFADYHGEDDLTPEEYEAATLMAQANGFEVIMRQPNQLLLDLDTAAQLEQYLSYSSRMKSLIHSEAKRWKSKSGRGLHVVVYLNVEVTPLEALALQAMLGSDPMREYLNLLRLHNGVQEPSRLFKPPGE